jgi:hypothetical protein
LQALVDKSEIKSGSSANVRGRYLSPRMKGTQSSLVMCCARLVTLH